MFSSNKNINNGTSDETFLFRIKKSESDVVGDLFLAIQNIVAGTAIVSNTVISDTCFQYKIHLSNDSPLITLHYEMKLDEKELLVPVVECKAIGENYRVDDDNNATKRNESFEITLPVRKETLFPVCYIKQKIPEVLSVLNNIENIDIKKLTSFSVQTKVDHSERSHCIKLTSDSVSNSDASESKLCALLANNSNVITAVTEEENGNSERVVQNKISKQIENNDINIYEERGAVIEKKYNCSYCGKLYKSISAKKLHERFHTGEKLFKCEKCGRAFTKQKHLTDHKRIHTGEKPFTCEECGKAFIQSASLMTHKKIHSCEKPYTCEECEKAFTWKCGLTAHKRVHTGEKPFTCEECGKAFTQLDSLTRHKRTHTGERPFTCEKCGKAFAQSSALQRHRRIHNNENYCISNVCGEAVSRDLSNKKTDTGKNRFSCEHCYRSFTYSYSLYRHMKFNHREIFKCEECGEDFSRLHLLNSHKRIHVRENLK